MRGSAQENAGSSTVAFRVGAVSDSVVSQSDSSERYAVYLPAGYTPARRWPLLIVFDPNGRARVALDLFRAGAERLGYIVMSGYGARANTLPGDTVSYNVRSGNAMLLDAQQLLAVDLDRLYVAGVSGTALAAWLIAAQLGPHVAGLITASAGLPYPFFIQHAMTARQHPLAVYLTAGTLDFNYQEVREVATELAALQLPHHLAIFHGPHAWPPDSIASASLEWLELQAMRTGLTARRDAWIDSLYTARTAAASALERNGHVVDAWQLVAQTVADFATVHDTTDAQAMAARLAASSAVREWQAEESAVARRERDGIARMEDFFGAVRRDRNAPSFARARAALHLKEILRDTARAADPPRAASARRLLARILATTAFFQPRIYLAEGDTTNALAMLDIAQAIRPTSGLLCYRRAPLLVATHKYAAAVAAINCALRSGIVSRAQVVEDSAFSALAGDDRFRQLLRETPRDASPAPQRVLWRGRSSRCSWARKAWSASTASASAATLGWAFHGCTHHRSHARTCAQPMVCSSKLRTNASSYDRFCRHRLY